MEYVNLGRTGMKVSRLALGCMTFGSPQWQPRVLDEAGLTNEHVREYVEHWAGGTPPPRGGGEPGPRVAGG
jgi:aryl-alcohol dehydrogenase-like predicted oxidoreductase